MAGRLPNPRRVKLHRNYTVEEVAQLCEVHRNTVRQWIKRGLPLCDDRRPALILGRHLRAFLENKRRKNKRPCQAGEIYCMRCRMPRQPAGGMADYIPKTNTTGALVGLCPHCEAAIYRYTSIAKLAQVRGDLDITIPMAYSRMGDRSCSLVSSDLEAIVSAPAGTPS